MSTTKDNSLSLPTLEFNTIINNIIQADGNELVEHFNEFLDKENISLSLQKENRETELMDLDTLMGKLQSDTPVVQQTRQLVQSYMNNVNHIQGLENKTFDALKNVEHAQGTVENTIQDIKAQQDLL
ncbi:unnamed protein product [Cunninghamella blakesleeana]